MVRLMVVLGVLTLAASNPLTAAGQCGWVIVCEPKYQAVFQPGVFGQGISRYPATTCSSQTTWVYTHQAQMAQRSACITHPQFTHCWCACSSTRLVVTMPTTEYCPTVTQVAPVEKPAFPTDLPKPEPNLNQDSVMPKDLPEPEPVLNKSKG